MEKFTCSDTIDLNILYTALELYLAVTKAQPYSHIRERCLDRASALSMKVGQTTRAIHKEDGKEMAGL